MFADAPPDNEIFLNKIDQKLKTQSPESVLKNLELRFADLYSDIQSKPNDSEIHDLIQIAKKWTSVAIQSRKPQAIQLSGHAILQATAILDSRYTERLLDTYSPSWKYYVLQGDSKSLNQSALELTQLSKAQPKLEIKIAPYLLFYSSAGQLVNDISNRKKLADIWPSDQNRPDKENMSRVALLCLDQMRETYNLKGLSGVQNLKSWVLSSNTLTPFFILSILSVKAESEQDRWNSELSLEMVNMMKEILHTNLKAEDLKSFIEPMLRLQTGAYLQLGQFKAAHQQIEKQNSPQHLIEFNLSRVDFAQDKCEEAIAHLKKAFQLNAEKYLESEFNSGFPATKTFSCLNLKDARQFLEGLPDELTSEDARENYLLSISDGANLEAAETHARKSVEISRHQKELASVWYFIRLSEILRAKGKLVPAISVTKEALQLVKPSASKFIRFWVLKEQFSVCKLKADNACIQNLRKQAELALEKSDRKAELLETFK